MDATNRFHFVTLPARSRPHRDGEGNFSSSPIPGAGYSYLEKLTVAVREVSPDGIAEVEVIEHPKFTTPKHINANGISFRANELRGARYTVPAAIIEPA